MTQATVYVTSRDPADRMRMVAPVGFEDFAQPYESQPTVMLDPSKQFQTIVGFGGAFTDAAAETFGKMPPDKQREILTAYFDPTVGIGYSLGRTNINSCDFSSDTYSYDDVAGDTSLAHFSIAHDLKYRVPFLKAARAMAGGNLSVFASPWSPPAWMKTNNDMLHGGTVKPEDRQAWASYYARFIKEYAAQGIPIWGLTVQNEPMSTQSWESCIFTAVDERDFVRDYLGPTLQKTGLSNVHLMIWDHNRGLMYQRAQTVYADPKAAQYVWGTAFHWYAGDHFEVPQVVHEAWPDKPILFTEGSNGVAGSPEAEWGQAERYALNEYLDLTHWSCGWCDWNLLLNAQGGPNHVGNFCSAPILADTDAGTFRRLPSFYVLGQFSKFVRPGARRIAAMSTDDRLQSVAFQNPDGSLAVVVLNQTDGPEQYRIWLNGRAATATSPPHSIETAVLRR